MILELYFFDVLVIPKRDIIGKWYDWALQQWPSGLVSSGQLLQENHKLMVCDNKKHGMDVHITIPGIQGTNSQVKAVYTLISSCLMY